jgi:peptide/nickel transport system substrate-binding protein
VYDSLLLREPDGSVAPFLASGWEYDETETTLTLTLEEDVTFSDGAPFDAAAVEANLLHFQEFAGPAGPLLRFLESVDRPDEHTVVLNLSAPDPALLYSLAGPAGMMGSPSALGTDEIANDPVGTGPYTLSVDQTVTGSEYVFVRKEDYWGADLPFDELRYLIINDETARLNALKSGEIDAALLLSATNAQDAEASGFELLHDFGTWEGLFFFDRDGALTPELADARVREALRIAIDAEALVDTYYGGYGELTTQIFPPDSDAYLTDLDSHYEYDPDRARQLLDEAGYADGFVVPFPRTPTYDPALYTAIEQYWREIGVEVESHAWGQGEAIPSMQAGDFSVSFFRNILLDPWSTVNFSVSPNARYNPFNTEDPVVSDLIDQMQSGDEDERADAAQEVSRYLVEQVWFGPLYRPAQFFVLNERVDAVMQPSQGVPSIYSYDIGEG